MTEKIEEAKPAYREGISRRGFVKGGVAAGIGMALGAGQITSVGAETPVPSTREPLSKTPVAEKDPLDVQIEAARNTLAQLLDQKSKKETLAELQQRINDLSNPPKVSTPTPTPRPASPANPKAFYYTQEEINQLIEDSVDSRLEREKTANAKKTAQANREIAEKSVEAGGKIEEAKKAAAEIKQAAEKEAEAMKGKTMLPGVGEVPGAVALAVPGVVVGGLVRGVEGLVRSGVEKRRRAQDTTALGRFLTDAGVTIAGAPITPEQTQLLVDNGYTVREYQQARAVLGPGFPPSVENTVNEIQTINVVPNPADRRQQTINRLRAKEDQLMAEWAVANPDARRLIEMSLQRIFTQLGGAGNPAPPGP